MIIIDCVSDLHGKFPELEGGDLLIIAGDCTYNDSSKSWQKFFDWLDQQKYSEKIMIAGNHDNFCTHWAIDGTFTDDEFQKIYPGEKPIIKYLCDSGTEFNGLKIWGSPWTASFPGINPHCCAFTVNFGCDIDDWLEEKWNLIPSDIDILITHSPPYGFFDKVKRNNQHVGSQSLRNHVMDRIKPKLHIFGHIHEWGGQVIDTNITKFVNASIMNENYDPVNKPIRVIL